MVPPAGWRAAACAMLAAFFGIKTMGPGGSAAGTEISSLYTPASGVAATAEYRADLDMTIVTLDGLDEIPPTMIYRPSG
ncbi:MAG: hypothetical protein R3F11_12045 [Verrucomicrobiales bacterium]